MVLVILAFLLVPVSLLWSGYVVAELWAWFAVPLGLPDIGIAWAIGIATLVRFMAWNGADPNQREESAEAAAGRAICLAAVYPAFALAFGWAAHSFM